mgnify:CR=1 FL=1
MGKVGQAPPPCTELADAHVALLLSPQDAAAPPGTVKAIMRGANQGIMSVQFSKNDEFLLAGANDNITRIWHVESGRARFTFTGHIGKVFAAKFSGDASRVVRATGRVDDAGPGAPEAHGATASCRCCTAAQITGSHDRTIKVWDLSKNYCTAPPCDKQPSVFRFAHSM